MFFPINTANLFTPYASTGKLRFGIAAKAISPGEVQELTDTLCNTKLGVKTRIKAAESLSNQAPGSDKAITALSHILDPKHFDFFEVKEAAALALGKMGNRAQKAVPLLLDIFERTEILPMIRQACLKALRQIAPQDPRLIPAFIQMLRLPTECSFFDTLRHALKQMHPKMPPDMKAQIKAALASTKAESEPAPTTPLEACVTNRMGFSRTLRSGQHPQALDNFKEALLYVGQNTAQRPQPSISDFIALNTLLTKGLYPLWAPHTASWQVQWNGLIRGTDPNVTLELPDKHPIKSKDVPAKLADFFGWFDKNYDTMDPFLLAANTYQRLIRIHPCYEACGRTTRLFTDWTLYGRGYYLPSHPEDYIRGMMMSEKAFANLLRKHGRKISEADANDPVLRTFQGRF